MDKETSVGAFRAVMVLALICSVLVAGAAVGLRPRQEANRKLDRKKNILRAAGLYQGKGDVEELFQQVETKVIRLADGSFVPPEQIDPAEFDQLGSLQSKETSRKLSKEEDTAGLNRQEKYSLVYLVKKDGQLDKVILPIRGKGLWSTLYGYLALSADLSTIIGITFYEHGETPGLGGEIENPDWQAGWQGKQLYDSNAPNGQPAIQIVKSQGKGPHQVDGVSGATLTMKGVNNLMHFWFGEHGFGPFLERFRGVSKK
ncbi:MAG: Na(+)-translocating NADH-quinone reductase subunit C [Candidatus Electrothrix sp. GW3-4]|uniref:Na(+)-translocating NADH-quinone reductase subunit C n=1 Tax=Candidatus Electrothrix sp. GW3-4 TaxID=3126740 RepID=UPI0030CD7A29